MDYQVPETVIKFRQGFGRLIRTMSDEGVMIILDDRIVTKQYGKEFRDSLPAKTEVVLTEEISGFVSGFFNQQKLF